MEFMGTHMEVMHVMEQEDCLLFIVQNLVIHGSITSNGSAGENRAKIGGGSSGGGSINIFYNTLLNSDWSKATATGTKTTNSGGQSGNGTVTAG